MLFNVDATHLQLTERRSEGILYQSGLLDTIKIFSGYEFSLQEHMIVDHEASVFTCQACGYIKSDPQRYLNINVSR